MKHSIYGAFILTFLCIVSTSATAGLNTPSGRRSIQSADPALMGTALNLDGNATYVDISNAITLNGSGVTGELWINAGHLKSDWQVILANWGTIFPGQFHLSINPGNCLDLAMTTDGSATNEIADPAVFPTGTWQHVAFTMSDHTMRLFRNGEQVASGTYTGNLNTSFAYTYVGAKPDDDGIHYVFPVMGQIDEVVLWGTGRDSGMIAVDMDTIYSSAPGGVIGYWHFNEGTGSTTENAVNSTESPLKNFTFDQFSGWVASTIPVTHTPLPIQLSSFTAAVRTGNTVLLEWATVSETNNYGFSVERSPDPPDNFHALSNSFVGGHGTTLQTCQYSYTDAGAGTGTWWYRLQQVDLDGAVHHTEAVKVEITRGANDGMPPSVFSLAQNYPNPFNPATTIVVALPRDAWVSLAVYNLLGENVAQLVDGMMTAGYHNVVFDASRLASGCYLYRLKAGGFVAAKRLLLVR